MSETWEVVRTRAIYGIIDIIGHSESNSLAIQVLKLALKLTCNAYVFFDKDAQVESKGPPSSTCWSLAGYDTQYVTQYVPCMLFSGVLALSYLSRWANFAFRHFVTAIWSPPGIAHRTRRMARKYGPKPTASKQLFWSGNGRWKIISAWIMKQKHD